MHKWPSERGQRRVRTTTLRYDNYKYGYKYGTAISYIYHGKYDEIVLKTIG